MTNIVKSAIDLVVPSTAPLTEKEWDMLDEAVRALDESLGSAGLAEKLAAVEMGDNVETSTSAGGKIVICMCLRRLDVQALTGI
jgi:hypothetical protein